MGELFSFSPPLFFYPRVLSRTIYCDATKSAQSAQSADNNYDYIGLRFVCNNIERGRVMDIDLRQDCSGVDWNSVAEILKAVGMAHYAPDLHRKAFETSAATVFVYHDDRLVGFGRAISDGAYQAAIYDCAVLPEFQGRGIGKAVMNNILSRLPGCNVMLYASPGKEGFYERHGFRKMKTGMAHFNNAMAMAAKGFTE